MYAADLGDLGVASIGAVAVIGAAVISARLGTRKTRQAATSAAEALGVPNGQGTVIQMLERSLENQGELRAEIAAVRTQQEAQTAISEAHSLEDHKRFRVVFDHLGIPYPEEVDDLES